MTRTAFRIVVLWTLHERLATVDVCRSLAVCDPDDPCDPADTAGDFVYTYDANGNVGQLIDRTPTTIALLAQQWHHEDRSP